MAKRLPPRELAKIRLGDFDYTEEDLQKMTARIEEEEKKKGQPKKRGRKRKEAVEADAAPPKVGRPRKNEEPLFVRSFRLPDRTIKKLRVRAAVDGISAADVIIRLVDELHVPSCDD